MLRAGRPAEAVQWYRRALELNPNDASACANLGAALRRVGDARGAVKSLKRSLALGCTHPAAHNTLGNALGDLGDLPGAIASYRRALTADPGYAEAHANLAAAQTASGRHGEAVASCDRALELQPRLVAAHVNRALALGALGRHEESLVDYDRALRLQPDLPEGHNGRGAALRHLGRYDEALDSYARAIALEPTLAAAHLNRGLVLASLGKPDEAVAAFDRAITLRPRYADAHLHRGLALQKLGRHPEAIECFDVVLGLKPGDPEAEWNKASAKLLVGDWRDGWKLFESRFRAEWLGCPPRRLSQPRWSGAAQLAGQTLFVHAEQGLGDTIQFCRYVPVLARLGARVVFEVQPQLTTLMRSLDGAATVIGQGEELPPFHCHCPLLSLPLALCTDLTSVPSSVPYLRASPERLGLWTHRLSGVSGLKVGIAWQGNPNVEASALSGRSVPLHFFRPLADVPSVSLISLQKGFGVQQLESIDFRERVLSLGEDLDGGGQAFVDSAAVMMGLDLVVTSDTAIAHLAGALGVPVWVTLHSRSDWRWLLHRRDSPWYPTLRLFRQQHPGDWAGVFAAVARELAQLGPRRPVSAGTTNPG